MDINGPGSLVGVNNNTPVTSVTGGERSAAAPTSTTPAEPLFQPTEHLIDLVERARGVPEVRQELIGEVARRLSTGELFLPPAPDRVVGGLLQSGALGDL